MSIKLQLCQNNSTLQINLSESKVRVNKMDQSQSGMLSSQTISPFKIPKKATRLEPLQNARVPTEQANNPEDSELNLPKVIKPRKKKVKKGYELASFQKALEHLHTQMYRRKIVGLDAQESYEPYSACDDNHLLKQYGLGVYLYLEFMKRLLITLFIMSVISGLPMYYHYNGQGLDGYPDSFTHTLAKFTLGNFKSADQRAYLVTTVCDILNTFIFFIFYLHFRSFYNSTVEDMQKDHSIVNPVTYALSIVGFSKNTEHLEQNLKAHFDSLYRGAYEVEVVNDYDRNFHLFMQLDQIIEKIQKEQQIINQTGKQNDDLIQLQQQLQEKQQEILHISQQFDPIEAIVHFRTLRSKYAFINFCKRYGLVDNVSSALKRCFCCIPQPPQKDRFQGKDILMINKSTLSRPQEINWNNLDISFCNKFFRVIISIILLLVTVFITSSAIGLCTLYAASTSNCVNFNTATTLAQATSSTDSTMLYCYCSEHYSFAGGNDAALEASCSNLSNDILVTNVVQMAASGASAVTNAVLIVAIQLIAQYLLKPQTKSGEYLFVFVLILLTNWFNTSVMPLLINGDIFSFRMVSYLSFIEFIDLAKIAIFSDFDTDWYAIIAPYYITFFIILCFLPFISLAVFAVKYCGILWWTKRKCESNNDRSNTPVIQKEANSLITFVMFDFPEESAAITLSLLMCLMYSSLIPILVPILTISLFITYFIKRFILLRLSIKIPANEDLARYMINIMPFMILLHCIFGLWSHTAAGIFSSQAYVYQLNYSIPVDVIDVARIQRDILMLGLVGLILLWIVFDFTFLNIINVFRQCCCKDQLQLPVKFAAIENTQYSDRIRKANIHGSYKLVNHPVYGHAIKAYKQLIYRKKTGNDLSSMAFK